MVRKFWRWWGGAGEKRKFWRWTVVMVAQQCECTYSLWVVHLKITKMIILWYIHFTTVEQKVRAEAPGWLCGLSLCL